MTLALPVRCTCGTLRGVVTARPGERFSRVVCYCADCQAFAHHLGRADLLDAHGGSDIVQFSPARLRFTGGTEALACLRLQPKGLIRWYARCCNTPMGNTPPVAQFAFVGLSSASFDESVSLDDRFGRPRMRVFARHARGDTSALGAHEGLPIGGILAVVGTLLRRRFAGDHRRSPFFDATTGRPVIEPYTLGGDERADLARRVAAGANGG